MASILTKIFAFLAQAVLPRITIVGIDVQDRHLASVAALRKGSSVKMFGSATHPVPEETIENGEMRQPEVLRSVLLSILRTLPSGFGSAPDPIFVVSVPPHHLYTETIFLPPMDQRDLAEAVHLKIENSLPWPVAQAYVDWRTFETASPEKIGVFIAAIARSALDSYLSVFTENNLKIGACEFHLVSLSRFLTTQAEKPFIFILLDEDGVEFSIFLRDTLIAHHHHLLSQPGDIASLLEAKVRQLMSYAETNLGMPVTQIFVLDTAKYQTVQQGLENVGGVSVQFFNPPLHFDPRILIAYGAALRPYESADQSINLVPAELGGRYRENLFLKITDFWTKIFFAYALIVLVVLSSAYLFFQVQYGALRRESGRETVGENVAREAEPLVQEAAAFNTLAATFEQGALARQAVGKKLKLVLLEARRAGLTLENARSLERGTITASFTAPRRDAALSFVHALEQTGSFATVTVPLDQLAREKDFQLSVDIRY